MESEISRQGYLGSPALFGGRGSRRQKRRSRLLRVIAILTVLTALTACLNHRIHRYLISEGYSAASVCFSQLLNAAMAAELDVDSERYRTLVSIQTTNDGSVVSLTVDMNALNHLRTEVCLALYSNFFVSSTTVTRIPIGTLTGLDLLSGRGYTLPIRVQSARSFRARFISEFTEAGINQTLHRVIFETEADYLLLLPLQQERVTVSDRYCVAETILLGKVPDAYTKISRLTDDISELEIDDLYDFGADAG